VVVEGTFRGRLITSIVATAKKLVPEVVVQEVQRYRAYGRDERSLYLKIRISNGLGFTNPKLSRVPKTARSFLFVCFGNIMRSPMCQALLNRELACLHNAQFTVVSAGLNAIPGKPAHPWAIAAAKELGIALEGHRAQLLSPEMVDQADVIFAMDYHNQVQLLSRWAGAKSKTFFLSAYAGEDFRPLEIRDPYYSGLEGTRSCYRVLSACIQNLVRALSDEERTPLSSGELIPPGHSGRAVSR